MDQYPSLPRLNDKIGERVTTPHSLQEIDPTQLNHAVTEAQMIIPLHAPPQYENNTARAGRATKPSALTQRNTQDMVAVVQRVGAVVQVEVLRTQSVDCTNEAESAKIR